MNMLECADMWSRAVIRHAYRYLTGHPPPPAALTSRLFGTKYQPIHAEMFRTILESAPLPKNATFIDLGCGTGTALILSRTYPFRHRIGIEYAPELAEAARVACPDAEVRCLDATQFVFPLDPLVVFLYNPFTGPVMQAVIDHLRDSLIAHPRPCVVLYRQPLEADRWAKSFACVHQTPAFTVYQGTH